MDKGKKRKGKTMEFFLKKVCDEKLGCFIRTAFTRMFVTRRGYKVK